VSSPSPYKQPSSVVDVYAAARNTNHTTRYAGSPRSNPSSNTTQTTRYALTHRANIQARLPRIHPLRRDRQLLLHAQREETSVGRANRRRRHLVSRDPGRAAPNEKKRVVPVEEGGSLLDLSSPGTPGGSGMGMCIGVSRSLSAQVPPQLVSWRKRRCKFMYGLVADCCTRYEFLLPVYRSLIDRSTLQGAKSRMEGARGKICWFCLWLCECSLCYQCMTSPSTPEVPFHQARYQVR
jgi:hypothetical protein